MSLLYCFDRGEGCLAVRTVPVNFWRRPVKRGLQFALLGTSGFLIAFFVVEYGDAPWALPARWLALIVYTPLVFGAVVREFRRSWGRIAFWLCVLGLLAVHTAGYAAVLAHIEAWRNIWFLPLSIAECPILVLILHVLGYDDPSASPRTLDRSTS